MARGVTAHRYVHSQDESKRSPEIFYEVPGPDWDRSAKCCISPIVRRREVLVKTVTLVRERTATNRSVHPLDYELPQIGCH